MFRRCRRRYGVALVGIKQNIPNASIQLNPGSRHIMKTTDICFYMSITKEENSAFILAHPNDDKEGVFMRHGSLKALARAGSYRYSKVTSIVATVGTTYSIPIRDSNRFDSIRYANRFESIRFVKKIGLSIHWLSCSFCTK